MTTRIDFPVARLVSGSVSKLTPVTDSHGNQKVGRNGKAREQVNFGIAIPKGGESSFRDTAWGAAIAEEANKSYPIMNGDFPDCFSWKVIDGDGCTANGAGKIPVMQPGYAGHWIVFFVQGWAPKLDRPAAEFVTGYYVTVAGDVLGNGEQLPRTPGLYMNPVSVKLAGMGEPLGVQTDVGTRAAVTSEPETAATVAARFAARVAVPGAVGTPVSVTPSRKFMDASADKSIDTSAAKPVVTLPAPDLNTYRVIVMLPAANGCTYEAMIEGGWTDALMIEHSMMKE